MRKVVILLLTVILITLTLTVCAEELRGWNKNDKYQYVALGTYPTEADGTTGPVLWLVLGVEDGKALLLSEKILDVQQVVFCDNIKDSDKRNFRKLNDYEESDLNTWMNETMLTTLCNEQDFSSALIETQYGKLYPLTTEQYRNPDYGFNKAAYGVFKSRQCFATDYAKQVVLYEHYGSSRNTLYVDRGLKTSPYWAATVKNPADVKLQLCGFDGHMSYGVYTRVNVGVRPAITVDLSLIQINGGQGTAEEPYVLELSSAQ